MSWTGKGRVAIAGVGFSPLARDTDVPLGRFAETAIANALEDAGLSASDIDGLATYPSASYRGAQQRDGIDIVGPEYVLSNCRPGPVSWYADLNSGMAVGAIVQSASALIAGACSHVLVWRAMPHAKAQARTESPATAAGADAFALPYGCASPLQWHALRWRRHLAAYGGKREKLSALIVNSRRNATLNPDAYFRDRPLSVDDYLAARMVSDPLCLLDCDLPLQGCVAIVMTTAERARDLRRKPAHLAGFAMNAQARPPVLHYTQIDPHEAGRRTSEALWRSAGMGPRDMSAAMLYDGFAPSAIYWLESAGFCGTGEALDFIQDGRIAIDGELPVNTFGGSLSQGRLHGMGHVAEAALQVTGRAQARQVAQAEAVCVFSGSPMFRGSGIVLTSEA
ncbi:MAG: hypothetical protein AB7F71_05390 [Burkholderiaceae bacterium]